METGLPLLDDPQLGRLTPTPLVGNLRHIGDGESVKLAGIEVAAHSTPGHMPGGISWSWQSCEGERCANMVYADSLALVSAEGYKFIEHPSVLLEMLRSIAKVEALPCDILVSVHPETSDLWTREALRAEFGSEAMLDSGACRAYADKARAGVARRIAAERNSQRTVVL